MARIRYLKPEFFTDEDLCALPVNARLLFAGMWCYADKAGRMEDRPKYLKAMIFPYENADVDKLLRSLTSPKPFINRYEIEGRKFIQISNWNKHQKPHHTEKDSTFPPAPPLMEKGMEKGMGMGSVHEASTELNNGEITVKEPLKTKHSEFLNVFLTNKEMAALIEKFGEEKTKNGIEEFGSWMKANGKTKKDHYAALLSWIKRDLSGGNGKKTLFEKNLEAGKRWLERTENDPATKA